MSAGGAGRRPWAPPRLVAMTRHATAPAVTFGVLGPVDGRRPTRGPVALRGPRQRAVLARLLIARGRVVPVDRLVDDLWEAPPEGAVGGDPHLRLRPAPGAGARPSAPAAGPPAGHRAARLRAAGWHRTRWTPGGSRRRSASRAGCWRRDAPRRPWPVLDAALALWRGPGVRGLRRGGLGARRDQPAGRAADARRGTAGRRRCWRWAGPPRPPSTCRPTPPSIRCARTPGGCWPWPCTGRAARARRWPRFAGHGTPWWRNSASIRAPGCGSWRPTSSPRRRTSTRPSSPGRAGSHPARPDVPAAGPTPGVPVQASRSGMPADVHAGSGGRPFPPAGGDRSSDGARSWIGCSGRPSDVARHGRPTLALVSGDAGAGKTALAEALTGGWPPAAGRRRGAAAPEYEGAPAAWPWAQITDALAGPRRSRRRQPGGPPEVHRIGSPTARTPESVEDAAVARFRLHRAAASQVTAAAGRGPLLLVVDDLHRADEGTLDLLTALLTGPEPVSGPVLIVGTYRATDDHPGADRGPGPVSPGPSLSRVYLGGLSEAATGVLARAVAGPRPGRARRADHPPPQRRQPVLRPGAGPAARRRRRRGAAGGPGRCTRRHPPPPGAAAGRGADRAAAGGGDRPGHRPGRARRAGGRRRHRCSTRLDCALRAGFLTEHGPQGQLRFTHVLVRDTLYGDLSAPRRARWHAAVGEAIERLHPDDVTALAHHFAQRREPRHRRPRRPLRPHGRRAGRTSLQPARGGPPLAAGAHRPRPRRRRRCTRAAGGSHGTGAGARRDRPPGPGTPAPGQAITTAE